LGKAPKDVTPAEAAFLVALPRSPTRLNPYKNPEDVRVRRNWILGRMAAHGFITDEEARRGQAQRLRLEPRKPPFHAPHFSLMVRSRLADPAPALVRTTLDLEIQTEVERLTSQAVEKAKEDGQLTQAAVLVMALPSREILAWVGSADFYDPVEGQNDGVQALRQPGSAVKPLTYATAFDLGFTPADRIDDAPVDYGLSRGVYTPANYDESFHGPVSLRTALASSLNVPAIKLVAELGVETVYRRMKAAGLLSLKREPDFYGLGITLGGGETTLVQLASAYATLASGGSYRAPVHLLPSPLAEAGANKDAPVFSPQAAYLVTHILSDDAARATGFGRDSLLVLPFPAAAKTGTSKNFRDNWCVGYTNRFLVAVWAGNFDARPMGRVSGITGAGPLWRRVMRLMADQLPPEPFPVPEGLVEETVCADSGLIPTDYCPNRYLEWFMDQHRPKGTCPVHDPIRAAGAALPSTPQPIPENTPPTASPPAAETGEPWPGTPTRPAGLAITRPRPGERYLLDPGIDPRFQNLPLQAQAPPGVDTLTWYINGQEVARVPVQTHPPAECFWPLRLGRAQIRLVASQNGQTVAETQMEIMVQ
jgi:penicillin-binding protein 1C